MDLRLRDEIRKIFGVTSLDFFYSPQFASSNSKTNSDWREQLQREVEKKCFSASTKYSISHSLLLGGAALLDSAEGQIGFDIEQTKRVVPEVALRISDDRQVQIAPGAAALFVAKEAAFKSLRGPRQPTALSEVEIINWFDHPSETPIYKFTAQLKAQPIQWFGACFEDGLHTVGLSLFPHST